MTSRAEADLFAPVYPFPRPELVSGQGAWVTDAEGTTHLDFTSGIAVNAFGHAPAGLRRAVARQMKELGHVSNLFGTGTAARYAASLLEATGYDRVFFCNSGTEAVEAALKFSRVVAAGRGRTAHGVTAFTGGFHGRTAFSLSATANPAYREPFLPLVPHVTFAPFNDSGAVADAVTTETAAVIVEPVQGESGAVPATREFLEALRARTRETGALLVFDEIQCGMGRTGRLLAGEHFGVKADVTVLSKALAGGIPFAAVLLDQEVAAHLKPGLHGSTFGGGPVATAAAAWVLERLRRPGFLTRVRGRGKKLRDGLDKIVSESGGLLSTRCGLGLLQAVEVAADAPFDAAALIRAAKGERLLLVKAGDRSIRFLPPLNVTGAEIETALGRFGRALEACAATLTTKGDAR